MDRNDLRGRLVAALARDAGPSSDHDLNGGRFRSATQTLRPAGVLVTIATHRARPTLVLTKRASHLSQHPGQIAFPGGKVEARDRDATDTALREAEEEIGLPRTRVEILGTLPPHETVTGYAMTPVLGLVDAAFDARAEEGEVAEIFEVPFDLVSNPARFRVEARVWRGAERRYYTVPWGPYYIWGATARVLRGLADRLSA